MKLRITLLSVLFVFALTSGVYALGLGKSLGGADGIEKQLDQLKKADRGPADKFRDAVAKGDLQQAMRHLNDLKSKLDRGQLNDQERQEMAKQFDDMKKKLKQFQQQTDDPWILKWTYE